MSEHIQFLTDFKASQFYSELQAMAKSVNVVEEAPDYLSINFQLKKKKSKNVKLMVIEGGIYVDSCWNKYTQAPIKNIKIPIKPKQIKRVLDYIVYLGTEEGFRSSNNFIADFEE